MTFGNMSLYIEAGYIIRGKTGGYIAVGLLSEGPSGPQNRRHLSHAIKGQRPGKKAIGKGTLRLLGRDSWVKGEVLKTCATFPWLVYRWAREEKNYREGYRGGLGRPL